jgi:hypothetical protein
MVALRSLAHPIAMTGDDKEGGLMMAASKKGFSLHVGLNAVDPATYEGWKGELVACEADAGAMAVIAKSCGFETRVLLKTAEATRDRVKDEILRAAAGLGPDDMFFLTYSGHGGQVPDRNGDEDDYKDETWCLFDGELIDDELYALWQRFAPGVRILVLSDSCHSGSVLRELRESGALLAALQAPPASADANALPRTRAMPPREVIRTYEAHREFYDGLQASLPGEKGEVQSSVRLISGCQDDQTSSDGQFNGLFTSTLLRVWKNGGFRGTYADFHGAIVKLMPPDQTPNHYMVGKANPEYDAQQPFTI